MALDKYLKYTELEYSRTFNLGNYESEHITLKADLDNTENLNEAFMELKADVFRLHEEGKLLEDSKKAVEDAEQLESSRKKGKISSLMSYDVSGVNWIEKVGKKGPFMLASERDNKNNPEYDKLFKTIKDRWDKKENTWPFWIFPNQDAIGKNIKK